MVIVTVLVMLVVMFLLAFFRSSIWGWLLAIVVFVFIIAIQSKLSADLFQVAIILLAVVVAVLGVPFLRRLLVSSQILKIFRKILPHISQTEQEALDAGTVWWDGDLFSGHPDWRKLLKYPKPTLSAQSNPFSITKPKRCAPCWMTGTLLMCARICRRRYGSTSRTTGSSA